ncbi:type VII secretion protein EccB [Streptomyces flavofungini]|uniref:Type VII secretion protein EccB n=1 Tax=Streptomyces flavofungini TaxID=68200 RepID=A0ABS0XJJ7_9ACTN|nr:type VII secretion protein EccB [Streptomyces flavofungini]MBJ3813079.1 type VII secretion protein EccB [Streptomyces flavofungini]GHC89233.1 type VII secretion protein EccB [Streptomyces flavofungini]
MASRRDELNAYTFAKRRTLAAFIQPTPSGSEESAPRPLRGVVPGIVVGVIVLAVFGAWGMLKPAAKPGWDKPKEHVIVASKSTTRYVVLMTDGKRQLHPVLNMASAKLLLDADKGEVIKVSESVLDKGRIPRGATIGIPYAPDRLPAPAEAGSAKRWAVCERPADGERAIQKAAFVFAARDQDRTEGGERLRGGELLYVVGPDKVRYVVDAEGTAYRVPSKNEKLLRTLVRAEREPQRVSRQWLETLHRGHLIYFPKVPGTPGADAEVADLQEPGANKVGMVLRAPNGDETQYYVVLPGRVAPVSDFTAHLLLASPDLVRLRQGGKARDVSPGAISPVKEEFGAQRVWPRHTPSPANEASSARGSRNTVCNVLRHVDGDKGRTTLNTWAGTDFPAPLPAGSSSAYVTPGSGQLYRQFLGRDTKTGGDFLVTDTGLRYAMQSNSDSATDDAGIGTSPEQRKEQQQQEQESEQARTRLGYADVDVAPVPVAWSKFLPTGPRLSTASARQPQGS